MEIAVLGGCMESGVVMEAAWGRSMQAIGRAAWADGSPVAHNADLAHTKGLHEGTPCRPLIG